MKNFKTVKEFFEFLNNNCKYLILRNWEGVLDESLYGSGHEDIDILCENISEFLQKTDAKPVHKERYRDNYIVMINGLEVRLDVRHVGDDYYPKQWEKDMIEHRVFNLDGFYTIGDLDYPYSLIYHSLLQKTTISEEYKNKINKAFTKIDNTEIQLSEREMLIKLKEFCKLKSFQLKIPIDPGVYINWANFKYVGYKLDIIRLIRRLRLRGYLSY